MASFDEIINFAPETDSYVERYKRMSSVFVPENGVDKKDDRRSVLVDKTTIEVEMSILTKTQRETEILENLIRIGFTDDDGVFGVPLWNSADKTTAAFTSGTNTFTLDEAANGQGLLHGFTDSAGSYRDIILNFGNHARPYKFSVSGISSGVVTTSANATLTFPTGVSVIPIIGLRCDSVVSSEGNRYNSFGYSFDFKFSEID